jgi:hypothetical protein
MNQKLLSIVQQDLKDRTTWADRQTVWYDMRHDGIRRRNKPFPTAADLHFPLVDATIDKLKPFYFAQIWGSELLASFIALRAQSPEITQGAAAWFHHQMVQETNFFREGLAAIDNMLLSGVAVIKLWWDPAEGRLEFDAIDPLYLVVPKNTTDLQKADRVTHVLQMSKAAYQRRTDYAQDEDTLKAICGKPQDTATKEQEKYSREGLTYSAHDDQIVLHEVWQRDAKGWTVSTYAPQAPDRKIKDPYRCTYACNGKPFLPFVELPMEVKDKGYYASRGVAERLGAFEAYANRTWNAKADHMTFTGNPLFTHEGNDPINLNNVQLKPGAVVPRNLQAVKFPEPAMSFDQELVSTRMTAESLIAMPDFGVGQQINTKERRTATEVNRIGTLMGMSTDLRGRLFRGQLGQLYRFAWALLREFKKASLSYYFADQLQEVQQEALHDQYMVEPDGSPDSWNKPARLQRAVARYQLLRGNEFVHQGELTKSYLEEDEPRLVRRLYQDPKTRIADQQEDQAMELAALEKGWPARVVPADDDQLHLQVLTGRIEAMLQLGETITPVGWQRINEHMESHLQQLGQRNPKAARQAVVAVQRVRAAMAQFFPPAAPAAVPGAPSPEGVLA